MEQIEKIRGAWVIRVRESGTGHGANSEDEKLGLALNNEMPFCNKVESTTDTEE